MSRRPTFGATAWDLVEAFFSAQRQYQRVFSNYETRVLHHAELQAVDRHQLRLEASEVSKLLDFASLGELRSGSLVRTKEISHALFRSKNRTHTFDRYVSEVYHDLSILREEQFDVERDPPLADEVAEQWPGLDPPQVGEASIERPGHPGVEVGMHGEERAPEAEAIT